MADEITLDVTTIEDNVTIETSAADVVEIKIVAPQGDAATVTVGTTTTGAAGTSASVTNSGSTSAAVLNFTIPRGATGPNTVTSATTSDGTANLSLSNVSATTATISGTLTANHIHGNLAGTLYTHVRTGEAMSKGDPFYISGFHVGSSQPIAMRADANDAAKMPAIGVMDADYAANTSGANGIISGTLSSIDTDGYVVNSPIFVANGGGYSNNTGRIPQQIGITERANANTGAFIISNATTHPYFSDVTIATDGALQIGAAYIRAGLLTDVRDYDLPDESGTFLLGEQLTSGTFSANISSLQVQSTATFEASSVTTFDTGAEVNFLGLNNYENAATFTYGATAATAHRTALGLGTLATQNANDATFSGTTTFNGTSYTFGTGAAAALNTATGEIRRVKTTDETRTAAATVIDNTLQASVDAGGRYQFEFQLYIRATGAATFSYGIFFNGTLANTVAGERFGLLQTWLGSGINGVLAWSAITPPTCNFSASPSVDGWILRFIGVLQVANAGTFGLQYANAAGTGTIVAKAGSYMILNKLNV